MVIHIRLGKVLAIATCLGGQEWWLTGLIPTSRYRFHHFSGNGSSVPHLSTGNSPGRMRSARTSSISGATRLTPDGNRLYLRPRCGPIPRRKSGSSRRFSTFFADARQQQSQKIKNIFCTKQSIYPPTHPNPPTPLNKLKVQETQDDLHRRPTRSSRNRPRRH